MKQPDLASRRNREYVALSVQPDRVYVIYFYKGICKRLSLPVEHHLIGRPATDVEDAV